MNVEYDIAIDIVYASISSYRITKHIFKLRILLNRVVFIGIVYLRITFKVFLRQTLLLCANTTDTRQMVRPR